ncbi:MAG: exodeoxyribonuclease III [Alphaproteobacteria bacterium]|nr:exodeoxyribonuclease III [Alphaproteobacteria bacterium]
MKVATWNVNSIKQRTQHVLRWLEREKPDALCLQELKGLEFPADTFKQAGYESLFVAQKAYNGVAFLTREPAELISDKLTGEADEPARYMEIKYKGITLVGIYAPNGNPLGTEKFDIKKSWTRKLIEKVQAKRKAREDFLVMGDFNIIPEDRDCYDPALWRNDALYHPDSVALLNELRNTGLTDAFRTGNDEDAQYTFWDYQAGAWQRNNGIRIDHIMLSPRLADGLKNCVIYKQARAEEQPSDHVPVWAILS